jgi:hypothetical protein
MELENIILSEVSLAQKTKNRMFSLTTFFEQGLPQTMIFSILDSQVARIIGMSHKNLAKNFIFNPNFLGAGCNGSIGCFAGTINQTVQTQKLLF